MRKPLMIMLLTIISSMKCVSIAQKINTEDKQKIIDYINCFYTAKYVLSDFAKTTDAEKQVVKEKGIDTVSIGYAYNHAELDSILRDNDLIKTADNLTRELDDRNKKIINRGNVSGYSDFDFVDMVVNVEDFKQFKFTRKDECDVRNNILLWYISQIDKNNCSNKNELENKDEAQIFTRDKERLNWGWLPLGIIILYILRKIIVNRKKQNCNDVGEIQSCSPNNSEMKDLKKEIDKLRRDNKQLKERLEEYRNKREEKTTIKTQNETNDEIRDETEISSQKDVDKPTTVTSTIIYYADIDVSNNIFVRTYKEETRISVYAIDVNQQTFVPIENKQLYEKLSMVNSSGVLDACEVKNGYTNGKAIYITPGKVQQEENGKWRIINKAIIEIK